MNSGKISQHSTIPTGNRLIVVHGLARTITQHSLVQTTLAAFPLDPATPVMSSIVGSREVEREVFPWVPPYSRQGSEGGVKEYRRKRQVRMKENATPVGEEKLERQTTRADDGLWFAALSFYLPPSTLPLRLNPLILAIMSDSATERPKPARKMTLDEDTVKRLGEAIGNRPEKQDLVNKNILKDDNVAPALQAAKEQLQRAQLEDKIDHGLQQRPKADELVKKGILQADEAPPS